MPSSTSPASSSKARPAPAPSHIALYRKYRPQKFSEITGQDHIINVLEAAVSSGNVSHAYLFSGTRGTGKTSIARIFARALGTSENDMYEIDAASNRGIDDIRAIRDGVSVLPLESRFKVYIVDEVHMLTKEAFNALLKTLEEPPAHVIFMLATTELDKLPETVVSRCQTFIFKKPSREILRDVITSVAKKEGFTLEAGGADLIAILGDGSFRDALGTLDKVLGAQGTSPATVGAATSTGKTAVSLKSIQSLTGAPKNTLVNDFLKGIVSGEASAALHALSEADSAGIDMTLFAHLVLEKARFALLLKSAGPSIAPHIAERLSGDDFIFVEDLAKNPTFTSGVVVELLRASDEMARAHIPSLPLELAVVRSTLNNRQK